MEWGREEERLLGLAPKGGMSEMREGDRTSAEMNLELIEEHQAEGSVFAQCNYLYISLEATSAYVIVPVAKVPRTQYSD